MNHRFVGDIDIPDALCCHTIRSPVPRGRLVSIEAPRLPPSYYLIRAADIPGENRLNDFPLPILAEVISYTGEPVALLIGPDVYRLEEFAAQCLVRAEREAPVFSGHSCPPEAILARRNTLWGEPERIFREAKTIVESASATGIQEHWYSEPAGAFAVPQGEDGSIIIHTATQWPFHVRRAVAAALNIPSGLVIVESARIGIHLDGKIWYPSLLACHAALGARITGKPVKLSLSRQEDFRYSPKRNGAEIRIRSALGERGQILATEVSVAVDLGTGGVFTGEILGRTCLASLGIYRHGAVALEGTAIATNVPPAGPLGGFGMAQGFFAAERHASRIADTLGQEPAEWRKNNLFSRGKLTAPGTPIQDMNVPEGLLDAAAAMGDYRRKWASYELLRNRRRETGVREAGEELRGIGIAGAYQGSGFLYPGGDKGVYAVELTLEKDGSLEIRSSIVSFNDEYQAIWRKIAGETLAVEAGAVRFVTDSTGTVPDSGPACLSRNITIITRLVERACGAIRKQRFRDPLPITVRRSCHPVKGRLWHDQPVDQSALAHPGWGAAVVEASIDPITYRPLIRGIWLAIDGGKILSEARARRSLKLSVIHAMGWALQEQLHYEEGSIQEGQMYDIPGPEDSIPITIEFIGNDAAAPKGIGELAFSCVPAAYVQAVSQAMDHPFSKIPLTAGDIWEAGRLKQREAL